MPSLKDQVAIVTGAASGIGRAIAERLAEDGAAVGLLDRNLAGVRETQQRIENGGGKSVAVEVDITSYPAVLAAVDRVRSRLGSIGILVNNAGWDRVEPFVRNPPELWDELIDINLKGPIYCTRAVVDDMMQQGGGKIVSISSDAARVGSTGEAVYSACKGGVISFAKTMARELARYGINVNVICPGPTDTRLLKEITETGDGAKIIEAMKRVIPFRRLGTPQDIAAAVSFFVSADASFITGQVLSVSGGLTMAG